jgi:ABC-type branched-subunit amino acid transport system permease subunit
MTPKRNAHWAVDYFVILPLQIASAIASLVLLSIGLAVIFGMMRVVNLAHGEFLTLGGCAAITDYNQGVNLWVAMVVVAPVTAGLFGALVERLAGILCFGQAAFFGLFGYTYAVAAINMGDTTVPAVLAVLLPTFFNAMLGYFLFWGFISDVYLAVIRLTVPLILFRFGSQTAGEERNIGEAPLGGFNGIPSTPDL